MYHSIRLNELNLIKFSSNIRKTLKLRRFIKKKSKSSKRKISLKLLLKINKNNINFARLFLNRFKITVPFSNRFY